MPKARSLQTALGLMVPVSTVCTTPGRPAAAVTAARAPASSRPCCEQLVLAHRECRLELPAVPGEQLSVGDLVDAGRDVVEVQRLEEDLGVAAAG